jgi:hypothetical protein
MSVRRANQFDPRGFPPQPQNITAQTQPGDLPGATQSATNRSTVGNGKDIKRVYRLDLGTIRTGESNSDDELIWDGNVIFVADSSSDVDLLEVVLDDDVTEQRIPFRRGSYIKGLKFRSIRLINAAQAGSTMVIVLMRDVNDNRISIE